jgi:hypothetical protein
VAARLLVAVIVLLAAASTARAQTVAMVDARPSLTWRAPAGCPDAASLRARVEQRLERSLDDVIVGVEVDVALAAGRYVARVDLRAMTVANDVRTLESKRCAELADAVAVIVTRVASEAIAKQRVAIRDHDDHDDHDGGDDLGTTATAISAPTRAPRRPRLWSFGARASAISGIGLIPKVGIGAELAFTVRRRDALAELAAARWNRSVAQFHDGAPATVDVDLDTTSLRVGWRPETLPLRAWASVEVGDMGGNNLKLPSQQLESGRWVAAGGGFGVAWQMARWIRLLGTTETMLAIDRVRFTLGDGIVVYAPSPMSFRATAGLELGWQ